MGNICACIRQKKQVGLLDSSKMMGGSSECVNLSAPSASIVNLSAPSASIVNLSAPSSSIVNFSAPNGSIVGGTKTGECITCSSVDEQIQQWSLLAGSGCEDEEVAEESNVQVFKALQMHPTWGAFFEDVDKFIELAMEEKFAEGGQAELYNVRVTWRNPNSNEYDRTKGIKYALKVFKKGTFLKDLQFTLPHGYLQFRAHLVKNPKVGARYRCEVMRAILLKDGRFAFLMEKEHFDLRKLIERNMKSRNSKGGGGPFSKEDAEFVMYSVALGVDWLHTHNIVHRDLNTSNILVKEFKSGYPKWTCCVADYECSIGVVGTRFFRAPEILQAVKVKKLKQRPEVFSKAADIYGYGMTCYEILVGEVPFKDHRNNDYDLVLNGERPMVPKYVEDWTRDLLNWCWQSNPATRPTSQEIVNLILSNSAEAKKFDEAMMREYGQHFRNWHHTEILE